MVKGLRKLRRKFRRTIPKHVRAATRDAMRKGADEVAAQARQWAPKSSGDLRDSIGWQWGDIDSRLVRSEFVGRRRDIGGGLRITIHAGNFKAFYARFVEFGTQHTTAQPFFFPAYRVHKKRILSRVTRSMKKAIRDGAK